MPPAFEKFGDALASGRLLPYSLPYPEVMSSSEDVGMSQLPAPPGSENLGMSQLPAPPIMIIVGCLRSRCLRPQSFVWN